MQDNQPFSNDAKSYENDKYLRCAAGVNCYNIGIHFLSSDAIHKIGLFCSFHRILLEESGLVDSSHERSCKKESNKKSENSN